MSRPNTPAQYRAPTISLRAASSQTVILRLARPPGYAFRPGQAAGLTIGTKERPYSIASSPEADHLEFLIRLDGGIAAEFETLRPGKAVTVSQAVGSLALSSAHSHHLMIASGTGIAPFMSMIRHETERSRPRRHFHLLHGESYAESFVYADELRALALRYPGHVHYLPSVSRPASPRNARWHGLAGRVEERARRYPTLHDLRPQNTAVYACGRSETVEAVQQLLQPAGFEIKVEAY